MFYFNLVAAFTLYPLIESSWTRTSCTVCKPPPLLIFTFFSVRRASHMCQMAVLWFIRMCQFLNLRNRASSVLQYHKDRQRRTASLPRLSNFGALGWRLGPPPTPKHQYLTTRKEIQCYLAFAVNSLRRKAVSRIPKTSNYSLEFVLYWLNKERSPQPGDPADGTSWPSARQLSVKTFIIPCYKSEPAHSCVQRACVQELHLMH